MVKGRERRFRIDAFTPDTLPMERLAEYMLQFAKLLGQPEHVHFIEVDKGSAVLRACVEQVALPKVEKRIAEALVGQGDPAAISALRDLDIMLTNDNSVGEVLDDDGEVIVSFSRRDRPKPLEYGPFREDGVLEGVVIKVGGEGSTVPIWLRDNNVVYKKCSARKPLARELARHYESGLIRVTGSGSWMRLSTGAWLMRSFEIKDFEVLDSTPLSEVIRRLHNVQGAEWGDDPMADLARLRTGEESS